MEHNIAGDLALSRVGVQETDENLNISDVIEVLQSTDPEFSAQSMFSGGGEVATGAHAAPSSITQARKKAFVQITEQPASKALRFRYECEGRSAGSIPGVSSTPENKTFPSIQVVGYRGRAVIVVSCVTKDPPYRPHPHNLVGKEGCKKGICTVEINADSMSCTFSNLGIQCVKKKDIEEALKLREEIRVDPYRTGFAHRSQPSGIDLNAVRLCFQVFLEGDRPGTFTVPLKPAVSDPIYDKKAMSDLVICKLSHCSCSVAGGQEIILLCEKVAKEDIAVRFYEEQSGQLVWEGFGDFQHTNVHKQTAISFRAPRYRTLEVDRPVKVFIQLKRPSDGATSEPLPFELVPLDSGRAPFWSIGNRSLAKRTPLQFSTLQRILAADPALARQRVEPEAEPADVEHKQTNGLEKPIDEVEHQGRHGNGISTIDKIMSEDKDDEVIVLSPDESPEEVIEERPQEVITVDGDSGIIDNGPSKSQTDRSLDDLLEQVAELDEIYTDAQTRHQNFSDNVSSNETNIVGTSDTNDESMDVDFDDNATYTSLQLAFKNPIDLLDEPISKTLEISNYDDVDITIPPAPLIQIKPDNQSRGSTPKPNAPSNMLRTQTTDVGWMIPPPIPPHPVANGKREVTEEKLPPLPPKRVKKTQETFEPQRTRAMTIGSKVEEMNNVNESRNNLGNRPQSQIIIISAKDQESADNIQNQTLPRPKKQGFLSKLFSKKPKKDKTPRSSVSRESSVNNINVVTGSVPSVRSTTESAPGNLTTKSSKRNKVGKPVGRSVSSVSGKRPAFKDGLDVIHIPLKGDSGSCVSLNQGGGSLGGSLAASEFGSMGLVKLDAGSIKQLYGENVLNDLEQNLDLTDAEHYALYTDVAPHATASEFDEASCYYAPVEGGKIIALTTDSNIQAINLTD